VKKKLDARIPDLMLNILLSSFFNQSILDSNKNQLKALMHADYISRKWRGKIYNLTKANREAFFPFGANVVCF
jgi:hypothetical protein